MAFLAEAFKHQAKVTPDPRGPLQHAELTRRRTADPAILPRFGRRPAARSAFASQAARQAQALVPLFSLRSA
jgi:hypothetical protein